MLKKKEVGEKQLSTIMSQAIGRQKTAEKCAAPLLLMDGSGALLIQRKKKQQLRVMGAQKGCKWECLLVARISMTMAVATAS